MGTMSLSLFLRHRPANIVENVMIEKSLKERLYEIYFSRQLIGDTTGNKRGRQRQSEIRNREIRSAKKTSSRRLSGFILTSAHAASGSGCVPGSSGLFAVEFSRRKTTTGVNVGCTSSGPQEDRRTVPTIFDFSRVIPNGVRNRKSVKPFDSLQ